MIYIAIYLVIALALAILTGKILHRLGECAPTPTISGASDREDGEK